MTSRARWQPVKSRSVSRRLASNLWLLALGCVFLLAGVAVYRVPPLAVLLLAVGCVVAIVALCPRLLPLLTLPGLIIVSIIPAPSVLGPVLLIAAPAAAVLGVLSRRRSFRIGSLWPLLALGGLAVVSSLIAGPAPDSCPLEICPRGTPSSSSELITLVLLILNAAAIGIIGVRSVSLLAVLRWSTSCVAVLMLVDRFVKIERVDGRLGALGLNPNYVGALLALGLVAVVAEITRHFRLVELTQALPLGLAVVATGSRGAYVGIVVGISVVIVYGLRGRARLLMLTVGVAAAVAVIARSNQQALSFGRNPNELDVNNAVRLQAARLAAYFGLENPILGVGFGHFPSRALADGRLGIYMNTHNEYLRYGAELGLGGAALFASAIVKGLRRAAVKNSQVFAVLSTYGAVLMFGNFSTNPLVSFLPFALLAALEGQERCTPQRSQCAAADDPSLSPAAERARFAPTRAVASEYRLVSDNPTRQRCAGSSRTDTSLA